MPQNTKKSCADLVKKRFEERMADIRDLYWLATNEGDPETETKQARIREGLGSLSEYGLGIDYVEPHTFTDQPRGYWRYQLSWGGPSEEFRWYKSGKAGGEELEFWYLDWYDGAHVGVYGKDAAIIKEIINKDV